jgi:Ca2+:H+ antiporter
MELDVGATTHFPQYDRPTDRLQAPAHDLHPPTGMGAERQSNWFNPSYLFLLVVPLAAGLKWGGAGDVWVFVGCGLAIIPLAGVLGKATEALAGRLGAGVGGLLNATFGNAAEFIIAGFALARGPELYPVVKATITGSILGNLLLVVGLAALFGGVRFKVQKFNPTMAGAAATMLVIACAALLVPTLHFHLARSADRPLDETAHTIENLSEEISVVLIVLYALSRVFTLGTHRHLFTPAPKGDRHEPHWGTRRALVVLVLSTAAVAVLSEWLVGAVQPAAKSLGLNDLFIGVVVVAIIGNAAEHATAVLVARRGRMGLALQIGVGSATQIALFVAPALVLISMLMGHPHPLDLHFSRLEVAAMLVSAAVTALICHDGDTNWFEGAMLVALYLILALAFYHAVPTR